MVITKKRGLVDVEIQCFEVCIGAHKLTLLHDALEESYVFFYETKPFIETEPNSKSYVSIKLTRNKHIACHVKKHNVEKSKSSYSTLNVPYPQTQTQYLAKILLYHP